MSEYTIDYYKNRFSYYLPFLESTFVSFILVVFFLKNFPQYSKGGAGMAVLVVFLVLWFIGMCYLYKLSTHKMYIRVFDDCLDFNYGKTIVYYNDIKNVLLEARQLKESMRKEAISYYFLSQLPALDYRFILQYNDHKEIVMVVMPEFSKKNENCQALLDFYNAIPESENYSKKIVAT